MAQQLTRRQTIVTMGLLAGRTYRQIGADLGAGVNAVRMLARAVYARLGVRGRAGLLRYAVTHGWIVGVDRGLHWTRREQLVLNGVLAGRSQRDIAEALGLSMATVDATLRAMRRYARASTTAELVRIAVEQVVGIL